MILTCYHFEISKNQDLKIFKIPMITYNRILYRKCYICFKFDVFCCYDNINIKFLTFQCTYIIIKNRSIWNRVCQVAVFEVSYTFVFHHDGVMEDIFALSWFFICFVHMWFDEWHWFFIFVDLMVEWFWGMILVWINGCLVLLLSNVARYLNFLKILHKLLSFYSNGNTRNALNDYVIQQLYKWSGYHYEN